ncbi:MAG: sulfite exporter TauE/SafE family protein [Burkholderiales bacterium]|nr:sulfite exporter TauE/SafE family protein [Burkholderiales bacterium]
MEPAAFPFLELSGANVVGLLVIGFVGGVVSGFIGSGGAFVLTPAMMSMGVPGVVAVASNLCHKFPKALVGAYKRHQFGQVDVKLGLVMASSAAMGVWAGTAVQRSISAAFGAAGSNLYVSLAFLVVLSVVGSFVLQDAVKLHRSGEDGSRERASRLARWVQSAEIPGTMMHFRTANVRVSALFTVPLGFATGLLASAIAVGGFIGVPGMIYVLGAPSLVASATELVIAFVMGLGGTVLFAMHGLVDIRLAMILLAGSLFGIQLGAIGTTYVRPYLIKVVMAAIMLIVAVSRGLVVPVYLAELGMIALGDRAVSVLRAASFWFLVLALCVGGFIILGAMLRGRPPAREQRARAGALRAE